MAIVHDRKGGRSVELLIPFDHAGKTFDAVHLKPILLDHQLRWQQGHFASSLALLAAVSGESEGTSRMLRYPDADRVLAALFEMLPESIRADITSGQIPNPAARPRAPEADVEPQGPEEAFTGLSDAAE
jgi:hypothetical protein